MSQHPSTRIEWQATAAERGERLDRAISLHAPDVSRSYASLLIEAGAVHVNSISILKTSHRLKEGDHVTVDLPPAQPTGIQAESIPLHVIYEDADLLVINKPAGMVVHPAPGHSGGTLVNAILAHVPNIDLDMGDEQRPGIVHRLDKDTSGLIVVAKRRAAHENLARQMAARAMHKEYLALVLGKPNPPAGIIDAPIARDPRDRQRMAIVHGGRPARTRYGTERVWPRYSLVRAHLETGRTHQIRVHMASTGYPLVGDPIYGKASMRDAAQLGLHRQFLHAHRLGFTLPSSGEWRDFTADLPEDLAAVLEKLEAREPHDATE